MSVYAPIKAIVTDQERAFELDCRLFNRKTYLKQTGRGWLTLG